MTVLKTTSDGTLLPEEKYRVEGHAGIRLVNSPKKKKAKMVELHCMTPDGKVFVLTVEERLLMELTPGTHFTVAGSPVTRAYDYYHGPELRASDFQGTSWTTTGEVKKTSEESKAGLEIRRVGVTK